MRSVFTLQRLLPFRRLAERPSLNHQDRVRQTRHRLDRIYHHSFVGLGVTFQ